MSVFKNPFFIICCILFWINQFLERILGIFLPYIHSYLDDLLAMPVVLGITLQAFRWFHPQKDSFVFTKTHITIAVVYFSLIFEVILPMKSDTYTRDPWDVLCYAIGAVAFYYWINKPVNHLSSQGSIFSHYTDSHADDVSKQGNARGEKERKL